MLATLLALAAEEAEEPSKTLFYICGGALAAWAVIVSAIGIRSHETFPATRGRARGVMGISVLLIALAMASAVITA